MKDGGDDLFTVWTDPGAEVEDGATFEGTLRVVLHPLRTIGGATVGAFTEFRLVDAVRR